MRGHWTNPGGIALKARLAIVIVAIACLAAPMPAHAESEAGLSVTAIRLTQQPQWFNDDPTRPTVGVVVQNDAATPSSAYRVTLLWRQAGAPDAFLNGDEAKSLDAHAAPLQTGQTRTHNFEWTLQSKQMGPGAVVARLQSVNNPANTLEFALPAFVASHRLATAWAPDPLELSSDEVDSVPFSIKNLGNTPESVTVTWRLDDHGQNRIGAASTLSALTLLPGEARTGAIYVRLPFDGSMDPTSANLTLTTQTDWGTNTTTPTRINSTLDGFGQGYEFQGTTAPEAVTPRGTTTSILVNVSNLGSRDESYRIKATPPTGWTSQIAAPAVFDDQRLRVPAGQTQPLALKVAVPASASSSPRTLMIDLQGDHGGSHTLSVSLRPDGPALQWGTGGPKEPIYSGVNQIFPAGLANVGTKDAAGVSIRLTAAGQNWTKDVGTLAAGKQTAVELPIRISAPGSYPWKIQAAIGNMQEFEQTGVLEVRGVELSITVPSLNPLAPGQTAMYASQAKGIRVTNHGSHAENVTVALDGRVGAPKAEAPQTFNIPAGATRTLPFSVSLPNSYGNSTQVSVQANVSIPARHGYWRSATQWTRVNDTQEPQIDVTSPAASAWSALEPLTLQWTVVDQGHARLVKAVLHAHKATIPVKATQNGTTQWSSSIGILQPGNYSLELQAVDLLGNRATYTKNWTVTQVPPPTITTQARANGTWNFTVSDTYGVMAVAAHVHVPGLPPSPLTVNSSNGTYTIDLSGFEAGTYNVTLKVTSKSGATAAQTQTLAVAASKQPEGRPHEAAKESPSYAAGATALAIYLGLAIKSRARARKK